MNLCNRGFIQNKKSAASSMIYLQNNKLHRRMFQKKTKNSVTIINKSINSIKAK